MRERERKKNAIWKEKNRSNMTKFLSDMFILMECTREKENYPIWLFILFFTVLDNYLRINKNHSEDNY